MNSRRQKDDDAGDGSATPLAATFSWMAIPLPMLAFTLVAIAAPVVASGALIDWLGPYEVLRVRVLGLEFHREMLDLGKKDLLTALGLGGIGVVAGLTALRLRRREAWSERVVAVSLMCVGGLFLAADEVLSVHETVGLNLGRLRALPLVSKPDDVIVALYVLAALVFAARYRRVVLASGAATAVFFAALVSGVLAIALDLAGAASSVEESCETLTAGLLLAGFVLLVRHHLRTGGDGTSRRLAADAELASATRIS